MSTLHRPGAFIGDMIGDVLRVSRVSTMVSRCVKCVSVTLSNSLIVKIVTLLY